MTGVLPQIVRHFSDNDPHFSHFDFGESESFGPADRHAPGFTCATRFTDPHGNGFIFTQTHLTIVTRVPSPRLETISNSFDRRFAPPSPRPRLCPVLKPSCNA